MELPKSFVNSTITVQSLSINYAGRIAIEYVEKVPTGYEPPQNIYPLTPAEYQIVYRDEAAIPDEFLDLINQFRNLWDLYDEIFPSIYN